MATVRVLPLNMASLCFFLYSIVSNITTAEFRGPGIHHNYDDSADDYDMNDHNHSNTGRSGRIILLGDGTEVLTDSDDADLFDHEDEDKDLDSQVRHEADGGTAQHLDSARAERESTPAPTPATETKDREESTPEEIEHSLSSDKTVTPTSKEAIKNEAASAAKQSYESNQAPK
jgi:protein phosphatase 2C family protein 2/3